MLTFILKKKWWEKIKSGEKTIEYREVKPYWAKRIFGRNYVQEGFLLPPILTNCNCKLRLGYTNKYLFAKIVIIEIIDGKDTDLAIDKPVYAIYLTDIEECEK
jgi:hypothetical protein